MKTNIRTNLRHKITSKDTYSYQNKRRNIVIENKTIVLLHYDNS